ncbi:cytochrome D1 domain-containing protein [Aquisphaera insulae]|uniref:cytochrome D1 domain-containing protein n=1 Tax=Aquisphaera insulae TaxID=2712864 RepID=UPI0013ED38A2|nr:cytochrome D1 domain-containing protein [Aquisphaera insulae]
MWNRWSSPGRGLHAAMPAAMAFLSWAMTEARSGPPEDPAIRSPSAIVATADGKTLYLACPRSGEAVAIDAASGAVRSRIKVPGDPRGLALRPDGSRLFATCPSATSQIHEIDPATGKVLATFRGGHTSTGPVLSPDGKSLLVCDRFDGRVTIHDLATHAAVARIAVPREPISAAVTPDGKTLLVAHHLPDENAIGAEVAATVSLVDLPARRLAGALKLPPGSTLLREIRISPDGRVAAVAHNLARFQMPTTQVDRGWMNTAAVTLIDVPAKALINTVLLDEIDRGAANPWAVAWSADGKTLAVSHAGTHDVSLIDAPALLAKLRAMPTRIDASRGQDPYSASRIAADVPNDLALLVGLRTRVPLTGNGPRAIAFAGKSLFVAGYFSDSIDRIDVATGPPHSTRLAEAPRAETTAERRGERLFNDASIAFQGWQSCASCHSDDGRIDGLAWDLLNDGLGNPKNTRSLLWSHRTPPAMSMGVRDTAETAVRSGMTHILFAAPSEDSAVALDAFLKSLAPIPPPRVRPPDSVGRGAALFRDPAVGCDRCHAGDLRTDQKAHDVGTSGAYDAGQLRFDTPALVELWRTAPYLHDGSSASLRDLLTTRNRGDRHGRTSHLAPEQIDALVAYLLSL